MCRGMTGGAARLDVVRTTSRVRRGHRRFAYVNERQISAAFLSPGQKRKAGLVKASPTPT
jgi:hypothetical protein